MSIIGIDIGTNASVVATVGKGVVSIVRNEISERLTPSLVGFSDKERMIGEAALSTMKSNFKNTCRNLKLLLGRTMEDPEIENENFFALAPLDTADDGSVGFRVMYKGEEKIFSAARVMAALLTKLKQTSEWSTGQPVRDVVVSCPGWFLDSHRRALLAATEIAGLNCLRIMNEHTATALDYGIYRSATFSETEAHHCVFVVVGHANTSIAVVKFTKNNLEVLAEVHNRNLGGRNMDHYIMTHMADIFKKKTGLDVLKNQKARLKMEEMANKTKKILSANMEAPFHIECLMEDEDLSALLSRSEFEKLCTPMVPLFEAALQQALEKCGLTRDQIHNVEAVGGCTRIPWIQECVTKWFGRDMSRTLHMDETIARGCALQAAMLSPLFRVKEFNVIDKLSSPISLSWAAVQAAPDSMDVDQEGATESAEAETVTSGGRSATVLFPADTPLNTIKSITFKRAGPFDIQAKYSDPESLPPGTLTDLGKYQVMLPALPDGSQRKVKVKVRMNLHGIFNVDSASLLEEEEYEEKVKEKRTVQVPVQPTTDATMGDGAAGEEKVAAGDDVPMGEGFLAGEGEVKMESKEEWVDVMKKKKRTKRIDLQIVAADRPAVASSAKLQAYVEGELEMANDDRIVKETKERMNELETLVYKWRDLLQSQMVEFVKPDLKAEYLQWLAQTEEWLYDQFDAPKSVFVAKLEELRKKMDPIQARYDEHVQRQEQVELATSLIQSTRALATSPEEKYSHIAEAKKTQLLNECDKLAHWLSDMSVKQNMSPLSEDPIFRVKEITTKAQILQNLTNTIMNEPKPAAPAPPPPKVESPKKTAAPEPGSPMKGTGTEPVPMEQEDLNAPNTPPKN